MPRHLINIFKNTKCRKKNIKVAKEKRKIIYKMCNIIMNISSL